MRLTSFLWMRLRYTFAAPPSTCPLVTVVAMYLFSSRLSLHFYAVFTHLRCNHLMEFLYMVGILVPVTAEEL